jgi:hypothetical protein
MNESNTENSRQNARKASADAKPVADWQEPKSPFANFAIFGGKPTAFSRLFPGTSAYFRFSRNGATLNKAAVAGKQARKGSNGPVKWFLTIFQSKPTAAQAVPTKMKRVLIITINSDQKINKNMGFICENPCHVLRGECESVAFLCAFCPWRLCVDSYPSPKNPTESK